MLLEDEHEDDAADRHHDHAPAAQRVLRTRRGRRRGDLHQQRVEAEQVDAVLRDRLCDLGVPVVTDANLGHGGHVQTWPIGVRARLDADARTLTFLEPPLLTVAG